MSEKIKKKLFSRKFWVSVTSFVTAILVAFNVEPGSIAQVSAIISAFGSLIAYTFAEAITDATHKEDKRN